MEKVVRTICQACHCECGVLAIVEQGKVVEIRGDFNHPMNRGFICVKGKAEPERLYHPDRLKFPLKRAGERGSGKWERVSWDQALDGIAESLTQVKETYGSEAIAAIHGTGPRRSLTSSLFPYYALKALHCAGANPVINVQNSKRVYKTLKDHLDFFVVTDFFMTPSAELADYVLPAATWLEREECCDLSYMGYVSARQKVVEPLHESWDELKILIELVKRIPWADKTMVPWADVAECNDWMVKGMGISFDELKGSCYIGVSHEYKKYENGGFHTPSGKVELHSSVFVQHGYAPFPDFKEPPESPVSTPELMRDYPLLLTNGGRALPYFHSEGRQIPSLRKLAREPQLELHSDKATELNIQDGDWVWLETPKVRGERVRFQAKLTSSIDQRVVHAPHGWWYPEKPDPEHGCFESNINVVMSGDLPRDEVCASMPTTGTLYRIYK